MKKLFLPIALFFIFPLSSFAQDQESFFNEGFESEYEYGEDIVVPLDAKGDTETVLPKEKPKLARWSLSLEGGINIFDGDFELISNQLFKNVRGPFSVGGTLDYTCTPSVSFGLMYNYHSIAANNKPYMLTATHHHLAPILSVNLFQIFSGTRSSRWGMWLFGGVGAAYSESERHFNVGPLENPQKDRLVDDAKEFSMIAPSGVNIEYNFTKTMALGLKFQYVFSSTDNWDLFAQGANNDNLMTGFLNLRWCFGGKKKSHTRNISMHEFLEMVYPNKALELAEKNQQDIQSVKKTLEEHSGAFGELEKRMQEFSNRLSEIEKLFADGQDSDGDGVPDHRDKEPNTPGNTPVDFWGKSMQLKTYLTTPFVFFEHNKYNLDNAAKQAVFFIAQKLKEYPDLLVEIRGFADYTGTEEYNKGLSLRRAERVKKELVEMYKIDAHRIGVNGKGRILDPRISFGPNRRVEFHFNE